MSSIEIMPNNVDFFAASVADDGVSQNSFGDDILDVQKIESNTLQLKKVRIDLNALISDLVADCRVKRKERKYQIAYRTQFFKGAGRPFKLKLRKILDASSLLQTVHYLYIIGISF
jgi:signal transduction histidine kinase